MQPEQDEKIFFARRAYYVQQPDISYKKNIELVTATFTTELEEAGYLFHNNYWRCLM